MAGRVGGRYALDVEVARGGMGVVYRGRDLETGEQVAVKVMLPSARDQADLVQRFQREAEIMARIDHPHVVRLRAAGLDFGRPYMVMDLVEGETLRQALKRGGFGYREAAGLVLELADALEAVHAAGALHRDVKPDNVLLDAQRRARLTDFGIVKLLEDPDPGTRTGTILGSPGYISPEQANGLPDLGPPTDVYGLGATFYELLTGQPPFGAGSVVSTLHAVLTRPPRPVLELAPNVPPGLARICERCLAKAPDERFRSAGGLAVALRTQLQRLDGASQPAARSAAPAPRQGGVPPAVVVAGALALVGGVVLGAWRAAGGVPPRAEVSPAQLAQDLSPVWSELVPRPLHPSARSRILPGRAHVPASLREGSLLGMQPEQDQPDSPRGFCARAQRRAAQGQREAALADVDEALRLEPWHRDSLALGAQLRWELGDAERAIEDLGRLVNSGLPSYRRRVHLIEQAYLLLQVGRLDDAERQARAALHDDGAQARRALFVEGLAHQVLGGVALRRGRFAIARAELDAGLASYAEHLEGAVELLYALAGLGLEQGAEARGWLERLTQHGAVADAELAWLRERLSRMGAAARKLDEVGVPRPGVAGD